jgi:formyltetrahydrofolate deformylase
MTEQQLGTLLISCPDQKGIVAAVAQTLYGHGANIVDADQHTDAAEGVFFQRVEFRLDAFDLARADILPALAPTIERLSMRCQLRFSDERPKVAILVSKQAHCLYDLLARWRMGELQADIPLVISNHPDHEDAARSFGIPFHHLPTADEGELLVLLEQAGIDLVVLARYMRILSPRVLDRYPHRIINIHHSFLPAFVGGRPYHQAHERGVKLIGATAHYATEELDQGPIIEQAVVRCSHRDHVEELVRKGKDLEKRALARAVRLHLQDRILVYAGKTVVFE